MRKSELIQVEGIIEKDLNTVSRVIIKEMSIKKVIVSMILGRIEWCK